MLSAQFPWVRYIQNQENVGFARANNQAFRESEGHFILLLNPDTVVQCGALEWMVRSMNTYPKAGAMGPQLLSPDGTLQISSHPAPTLPREVWQLFHLDALWPYGVYRMRQWNVSTPRKVDVLQGACLLLRRAALDELGLFDEDYFMYSEEVDLCQRLRRAGWSLYWMPQAKVMHYGGQSTQQAAAEMFLHLYRSKLLYFRKHHSRLTALAYKLTLAAAALARVSLSPLAWLVRRRQRQRDLILVSRYLHLLRMLPQL
jgi:GT2 family glycosyltransferase